MTARVAASPCMANASALAINLSQPDLPALMSLRNLAASRWSPVNTLVLIAPERISLFSTSLRPATILANSLKELSTGVASVPVVNHAFKGSRTI